MYRWLLNRFHKEFPKDLLAPHFVWFPSSESVSLNWNRHGIDFELTFPLDETVSSADLEITRKEEKSKFVSLFINYPYKRGSIKTFANLMRFELGTQYPIIQSKPKHIFSIIPYGNSFKMEFFSVKNSTDSLSGELSHRNKKGIERAIKMILDELPDSFPISLLGDVRNYSQNNSDHLYKLVTKTQFESLMRILIDFSKITLLSNMDVEVCA